MTDKTKRNLHPPMTEKSASVPVPDYGTCWKTCATDLKKDRSDDEEGLSKCDEALSEGDFLWYGDDSELAGPPNLQRLVPLGQEHCGTPFCLMNNTGVKVADICGQKVKDCKRHVISC